MGHGCHVSPPPSCTRAWFLNIKMIATKTNVVCRSCPFVRPFPPWNSSNVFVGYTHVRTASSGHRNKFQNDHPLSSIYATHDTRYDERRNTTEICPRVTTDRRLFSCVLISRYVFSPFYYYNIAKRTSFRNSPRHALFTRQPRARGDSHGFAVKGRF